MDMINKVEIGITQSYINAVKLDNYVKSRRYNNIGQAVEALFQKSHISLCLSSGQMKNSRICISEEVKLLMDTVSHRLGLSSAENMLDFLVACRDIFGDNVNLDLSSWHSVLSSLKYSLNKFQDQKTPGLLVNKRDQTMGAEPNETFNKEPKCLKKEEDEPRFMNSENAEKCLAAKPLPVPFNIMPIKEEPLASLDDSGIASPGPKDKTGEQHKLMQAGYREPMMIEDSDEDVEMNRSRCHVHGSFEERGPLAQLDDSISKQLYEEQNAILLQHLERVVPPPSSSPHAVKQKPVRTFRHPLSDESIAELDGSRFPDPVPDDVIDEMQQKKYAKATERKLRWMLKLYDEWRENRNKIANIERINADLHDVENLKKEDLCYAMKRFIVEARKESGEDYPGTTLNDLLFCAQCHLYKNGLRWRLMDEKEFYGLKTTVENEMKRRAELVEVQGRDTITEAMEGVLWTTGVLGEGNPEQLQDTVLYLIALHFGVKSGTEQKGLRRPGFNSQFQLVSIDNRITYLKYIPEKQHGKNGTKEVVVYPSINPSRCPVRLFAKYVSLLPPNGKVPDFYLRPQMLRDKHMFYKDIPVGINKLSSTIRRMCLKAGLVGNFNNASVRHISGSQQPPLIPHSSPQMYEPNTNCI